jgi:hypothetical protein
MLGALDVLGGVAVELFVINQENWRANRESGNSLESSGMNL